MPGSFAIAAAVVMGGLAALAAWAFVRRLGTAGEGGRAAAVLGALVVLFAAWTAFAVVGERPFVALHAVLWAGCAAVFCAASGGASRGLLTANLVASCFGASQMLAFSLVGIIMGGGMLWSVNADDTVRPLAIAAGCAVFVAVALVLCRLLKRFPLAQGRHRSPRALYGFSWFSLAYILFDALPSLSRLELPMLSFFLAGSTVLLIGAMAAFLAATSLLGRDAQQREEYLALMARRDSQQARLDQLRDQAYRDALTGLISRRAGVKTVRELLAAGRPFAVAYLDMNNLKAVNDSWGHKVGDACLRQLARALVGAFPTPSTVCRMSGDEFLVIAEGRRAADVDEAARSALKSLACSPLDQAGAVTFSWGSAEVPAHSQETAASLIGRADGAMYAHKRAYHGEGGA